MRVGLRRVERLGLHQVMRSAKHSKWFVFGLLVGAALGGAIGYLLSRSALRLGRAGGVFEGDLRNGAASARDPERPLYPANGASTADSVGAFPDEGAEES